MSGFASDFVGGFPAANAASLQGTPGVPSRIPNQFAPEPLNFAMNGSNMAANGDDPKEPGTFTFRDLQNISDVGSPSMKGAASHSAYEDALLQYSGLNEEEGDAFNYNLTPGNSPMKFKQEPMLPFASKMSAGGANASAKHGVKHGVDMEANLAATGRGAGAAGARARGKKAATRLVEDDDDDDDDDDDLPLRKSYKLTREEAIALLNKDGGVASEDELNEIDPGYLTAEEIKKLKRMRRAIRNRESATASRMRRKEYIESLEKRTSELCSENAMLDLSVTEMQMREKAKAEELERIRQENEMLRKETYNDRAENHQLKRDKQVIEEKLRNVKLVNQQDEEPEFSQPGTWPLPRNHPQRIVIQDLNALKHGEAAAAAGAQRMGAQPMAMQHQMQHHQMQHHQQIQQMQQQQMQQQQMQHQQMQQHAAGMSGAVLMQYDAGAGKRKAI